MLGFIVALALAWYFFNFIENNSFLKNVIIYSVANFSILTIDEAFDGTGFHIISNIIASIVGGLVTIKIMEFVKARTNSLVMFVVLTELCQIAISFCIAFIVYKVL